MAEPRKRAKPQKLAVQLPAHIIKAARAAPDPVYAPVIGGLIQDRSYAGQFINGQIADVRGAANISKLLRFLARTEGPVSTAVHNLVQTANNGYSVAAYTTDTNVFDAEGTNLALSLIAQLNTLYNYTEGFSTKRSFESTLEMMFRETILTNGVACELVLNKALLPEKLEIIPLETIDWRQTRSGPMPEQKQKGKDEPVSLDIPTFWVERMPGDPGDYAPRSMMEAAVKLLIYFEEFLEDIRRVVRQSGHARQVVTLDIEKAVKTAPRAVAQDPKELTKWLNAIRDGVQKQLESISPEEALVMYDTATYKIESPSFGNKIDYTPMLNALSGMWATSMKTPPSALGMRLDGGGSATGNVETLMFMKSAKALHTPVATVISRALTLAARLNGADVYVVFEFDGIDLRPEAELEAFTTMRQTRILTQLSYGFISDDQAAVLLRTGPRPAGAPKLSGTMFMTSGGAAGPGNGSADLPVNPGDTPIGRGQQPDKNVPRKAGGKSQ